MRAKRLLVYFIDYKGVLKQRARIFAVGRRYTRRSIPRLFGRTVSGYESLF